MTIADAGNVIKNHKGKTVTGGVAMTLLSALYFEISAVEDKVDREEEVRSSAIVLLINTNHDNYVEMMGKVHKLELKIAKMEGAEDAGTVQ